MADLFVTFCKTDRPGAVSNSPVPRGDSARTQAIAIGASSARTTIAARQGDYVSLKADADCFIGIVASDGEVAAISSGGTATGSVWPMASGERLELDVETDQYIAVIQK